MRSIPVFLGAAIVVAAGACGSAALPSGPAWPKSAGTVAVEDWKDDGGESLEPRTSTEVAALEDSGDEAEDASEGEDAEEAETEATADETATDESSGEVEYEEIFVEEEIVIEGD